MRSSREWKQWRVGTRVVIVEPAWSGKTGQIVRYERGPGDLGRIYGLVPVVRIDGTGEEVLIWEARYLKPEGWEPRRYFPVRPVGEAAYGD